MRRFIARCAAFTALSHLLLAEPLPTEIASSTASPISYPVPLPGATPQVFLPGLICHDGPLEFNAAFSPDGKSFYFSRTQERQWDIFVSHHDGQRWTEPVRAPFAEEHYSEADPMFAPDGKLYFISNRPKSPGGKVADFDIWFIEQLPGDAWSPPRNASALNSEHNEYYIAFSKCGDAYFGSNRPGGFGAMDLYVSRRVDGRQLPPENLGPNINTAESEHDPCFVDTAETMLVFKSENRPDGVGEADLYASRRSSDGSWTRAINLGRPINTPAYEYCCYLTPDARFFFFSSELDIKWIDGDALRRRIEELTVAAPRAE